MGSSEDESSWGGCTYIPEEYSKPSLYNGMLLILFKGASNFLLRSYDRSRIKRFKIVSQLPKGKTCYYAVAMFVTFSN